MNLEALRQMWLMGDSDFFAVADQTVKDAHDLRVELMKKGWFGGGS